MSDTGFEGMHLVYGCVLDRTSARLFTKLQGDPSSFPIERLATDLRSSDSTVVVRASPQSYLPIEPINNKPTAAPGVLSEHLQP